MTRTLQDLETPCAVLDETRMQRNIDRLRARLDDLGVRLRPHLKTTKSVAAARRVMPTPQGPAMVSTVKEIEQFFAAGVTDITYGVGIEPAKLERIVEFRRRSADVAVILDSLEQARLVAAVARRSGDVIPAFIELDVDDHRSGVKPHDADGLC